MSSTSMDAARSRSTASARPQAELAELFSVSRTTVYREIQRRGAATKPADGP